MESSALGGTLHAAISRSGDDLPHVLERVDRATLLALAGADLETLRARADAIRAALAGNIVRFNVNRHIEPTNICRFVCTFCSFARHGVSEEGSFRNTVEEIIERTKDDDGKGITEYHIVGGVDLALGLEYYTSLIAALRREHPKVTIKALSAVEIGDLARRSKLSFSEVLIAFRDAGADAITGGGAEIFAPRVRKLICATKINGDEWLEIHRAAHEAGLRSNATILFGHFETMEERIDHMLAIRELQDRSRGNEAEHSGHFNSHSDLNPLMVSLSNHAQIGVPPIPRQARDERNVQNENYHSGNGAGRSGFGAFIPLPFVPYVGTRMEYIPAPSREEYLRMIALSRIALDNFGTIKAYWPAAGIESAKTALLYGANDLDGTVTEETIYQTGQNALTRAQIEDHIRSVGRQPMER